MDDTERDDLAITHLMEAGWVQGCHRTNNFLQVDFTNKGMERMAQLVPFLGELKTPLMPGPSLLIMWHVIHQALLKGIDDNGRLFLGSLPPPSERQKPETEEDTP